MYKFVRYEQKDADGQTFRSDWMFVPQSLKDIEDFHKNYTLSICNKEFKDCLKSVSKYANHPWLKNSEKKFFNGSHPESVFQVGLQNKLWFSMGDKSWIEEANDMVVDLYNNRVKSFNKGYVLMYSSDGLVSVPQIENLNKIIEVKYMIDVEFPKLERPNESSIKIIKWPGGTHYYAKVGNYDVVINGVQKWNTEYGARNAAKQFINSL